MNYEQERGGLKSRLASAANMPKDVVLGASVVTILGDSEVCIENYRGIVEYTECLIRVQTKGSSSVYMEEIYKLNTIPMMR